MKHLYYMTYIEPCPSKRNPFSRVMKFTTLVGFSLVIIIYILSLSDLCPGVEMISIEIHKFFTFSPPPPNYLPFGMGCHEIYNVLSPYSKNATNQIW